MTAITICIRVRGSIATDATLGYGKAMGESSCRGVCLFNIPRTLEIRDLRHSSVVPLDVLQFTGDVRERTLLRVAGVDVGGRRKGFHAAVIERGFLLAGPVPLRSVGSAISGSWTTAHGGSRRT